MKARFFCVLPAACAAVLLACGPAWSDVIVLLNGRTLQGTLADRDELTSNVREDVVILLDADPGAPPEVRRVAIETIDFVVLEANGARRVIDVRGPEKASGAMDTESHSLATSRAAAPRFPYTEGPAPAHTSGGTSRLGTGATLLVLGAATAISGAVIDFDSQESVGWSAGSAPGDRVDYDARNYVVMGIGGVVMLTGLALIASSGRPSQPVLGIEMAPDGPGLAYRRRF